MWARCQRWKTGDEAVLMGKQGHEEIFAAELAQKAGTIAWGNLHWSWPPG